MDIFIFQSKLDQDLLIDDSRDHDHDHNHDNNDGDDYNGPRNLDRVICYTWERKRGGPSGEFEEAASAVV